MNKLTTNLLTVVIVAVAFLGYSKAQVWASTEIVIYDAASKGWGEASLQLERINVTCSKAPELARLIETEKAKHSDTMNFSFTTEMREVMSACYRKMGKEMFEKDADWHRNRMNNQWIKTARFIKTFDYKG